MIQRIQTLFLLLASGLIISLFFSKIYSNSAGEVLLYVKDYTSLVLTLVSSVLGITTIFNFKKRIFQIRLCNLNSLILIGFQSYLLIKYLKSSTFFAEADGTYLSFTIIFPIVAAILNFLAMRYIARDEAMVIAASRLRPARKK